MPAKVCNRCARIGCTCGHRDPNAHWSPNRDRQAQHRFRTAVLARDGHQCVATDQGQRCPATTDLRAAHIIPLAEGGSYHPDNGRTLCRHHDRLTDPHAR
jgi:5-methylcytosine-specific restriction endonuclease McrA